MKKYALTENVKRVEGMFVRQIVALRSFGNVKAGDLGGYISKEDNLSHDGDCWVYPNGVVAEHATVTENARIVCGIVDNSATISGNAIIGRRDSNRVRICGNATVTDNARVYDYAIVSGFAVIRNNADVTDYARVDGNAVVQDNAHVFHHAELFGNAILRDQSFICCHAKVGGETALVDGAHVADDSVIVDGGTISEYHNRKYKLLKNDTKIVDGRTLYRIVAVQDAPFHHYGELGGYIESEANLSHVGNCWIRPNACVYGDRVVKYDEVVGERMSK